MYVYVCIYRCMNVLAIFLPRYLPAWRPFNGVSEKFRSPNQKNTPHNLKLGLSKPDEVSLWGLNDMDSTYGLWALIEAECLPIERPEILSEIGRKIVDDNQCLWRELYALREIYSEVHMLNMTAYDGCEGKNPDTTSNSSICSRVEPLCFNAGLGSRSPNSSYKNMRKQALPRRLYNDEQSDSPSTCTEDIFEQVRPYLNLQSLIEVADTVRKAILHESKDLEKEIKAIQGDVDDEVEVMSPMNSNRSGATQEEENSTSEFLSIGHHPRSSSTGGGISRQIETIKISGALNIERRREAGTKGSSAWKGSRVPGESAATGAPTADRAQELSLSHEKNIPFPQRARKSRLRSRLMAACEEKYFLDDDFF